MIDFQGVAQLIDTVSGAKPQLLGSLFQVLFSSLDHRLETRVVIELVLRCRDPLAPMDSLCRDGLKAAADFDRLLRTDEWDRVDEVCTDVRANALLHLCDEVLQHGDTPVSSPAAAGCRNRVHPCKQIRPKLKLAAVHENNTKGELMEHLAALREVRCPELWELFREFLVMDRALNGCVLLPNGVGLSGSDIGQAPQED